MSFQFPGTPFAFGICKLVKLKNHFCLQAKPCWNDHIIRYMIENKVKSFSLFSHETRYDGDGAIGKRSHVASGKILHIVSVMRNHPCATNARCARLSKRNKSSRCIQPGRKVSFRLRAGT